MIQTGSEVYLFHRRDPDTLDKKNSKIFYYPFLNQVPVFSRPIENIFSFQSNSELMDLIKTLGINVSFSLHSLGYYRIKLPNGSKWFVLQHGADSFKEDNFEADSFFVYTKSWLSLRAFSLPSSVKTFEVGQYYVQKECLNRAVICQKYNLSPGKKFILFTPLPDSSFKSYFFIKGKFRRYLAIAKAKKQELSLLSYLKTNLKDHGYEILIKSRFKRMLGKEYSELGHVFYDESFYPSTVSELISISEKVLINFMPGAIITEAASLNKDYIIIKQPDVWDDMLSHVREFKDIFFPDGPDSKTVSINDYAEICRNILKPGSFSNTNYEETYIFPKCKNSQKKFGEALGL